MITLVSILLGLGPTLMHRTVRLELYSFSRKDNLYGNQESHLRILGPGICTKYFLSFPQKDLSPEKTETNIGVFHLHFFVFPFVYHFNSRIEALVCSEGFQKYFSIFSASIQHHFKNCLLWLLHEKNVAFTLISFAVLK